MTAIYGCLVAAIYGCVEAAIYGCVVAAMHGCTASADWWVVATVPEVTAQIKPHTASCSRIRSSCIEALAWLTPPPLRSPSVQAISELVEHWLATQSADAASSLFISQQHRSDRQLPYRARPSPHLSTRTAKHRTSPARPLVKVLRLSSPGHGHPSVVRVFSYSMEVGAVYNFGGCNNHSNFSLSSTRLAALESSTVNMPLRCL